MVREWAFEWHDEFSGAVWPSVSQCAYRYMRRHKLDTVGAWNHLVGIIANRSSGNEGMTVRRLQIAAHPLRKAMLEISNDGACVGANRFKNARRAHDIHARAIRMAEFRRIRLSVESAVDSLLKEIESDRCYYCKTISGKTYVLTMPDEDIKWRCHKFCLPCMGKAAALRRRIEASLEITRLINATKREIAHERKQRQQNSSNDRIPSRLPREHDGWRQERNY